MPNNDPTIGAPLTCFHHSRKDIIDGIQIGNAVKQKLTIVIWHAAYLDQSFEPLPKHPHDSMLYCSAVHKNTEPITMSTISKMCQQREKHTKRQKAKTRIGNFVGTITAEK